MECDQKNELRKTGLSNQRNEVAIYQEGGDYKKYRIEE